MRWLEWISDRGYKAEFAESPPYLAEDFNPGVLGASAETSKGIRTHGVETLFVSLEPRHISLTGAIVAVGNSLTDAQAVLDRHRQELSRMFNPRFPGMLIWHNEAGSYRIRCRPVSSPAFKERAEWTQGFTVEFQADKPMWESNDLCTTVLGRVTNMWVFPWTIPTVFSTFLNVGSVQNDAGEEIYPVLRVSPTESELVRVENETTGKALTLTHRIEAGQTLIVDMADYSVTLCDGDAEENVSHWVDGVYWALAPGENIIRITTDQPVYTPDTVIEWRVPIAGV